MKSLIKKLFGGQTLMKFSGTLLVKLLGTAIAFLSQVALTNILGASEYGDFVYIFSWVMTLSLIARLGFDNLTIHLLPKYLIDQKQELIKGLIRFTRLFALVLSLVIGGIYLLSAFYLVETEMWLWTANTIAMLVVLPLIVLAYLNQSLLVALKKTVIANIPILILRHLILTIGVFLVYQFTGTVDVQTAMLINAIAIFLAFAMSFWWISREMKFLSKLKKINMVPREWLRKSLPYTIYGGASFLNRRADILMLGAIALSVDVAVYNVSFQLISFLALGINIVNQIAKPKIVEFFARNDLGKVEAYSVKMALLNFAFTLVASLVLVFLGKPILSIFGPEFEAGYEVVMIFALGRTLSALFGISTVILAMSDYQKLISRLELVFLLLNILLNYLLIPIYGVVGAAIATSIALFLRRLTDYLFCINRFKINVGLFNLKQIISLR
ncbi:MAG: oligosaccharide flippase family protein [Roseivirga sp.]|nr:oligosaccharide flippase family protein [Roseivirga sp.]